MIFFFVFLGLSISIASLFFIYVSNQLVFEKEKQNIIKLQLIGYSYTFIRSQLLNRSMLVSIITLLIAFSFGHLGITYILNLAGNIVEFENVELRIVIIYSLITTLFLLIIYLTNRKLKIRGIF